MRAWLRKAATEVDDNLLHISSHGHEETEKFDFPSYDIPFGQIAEMRVKYARKVSDLLERVERRREAIYWEWRHGDDYDATMIYFEEIAHPFWSTRRIYREIAQHRGLEVNSNKPEEIRAIRRGEEKARKYRELEKVRI